MNLTQKERDLLKDLKDQEQLCIEKYTKHAQTAVDSQLKNLFNMIRGIESKHLDTLNQIENAASCPQVGGGSSQKPTFTATYGPNENNDKKTDCFLCSDVLTTEKHASHLYDTCIFEFVDENVRNVLNHIQKEEQEHGKMIYDYMNTNAMYS